MRLTVVPPAEIGATAEADLALSPDGRYLVISPEGHGARTVNASRLWLWRLDSRRRAAVARDRGLFSAVLVRGRPLRVGHDGSGRFEASRRPGGSGGDPAGGRWNHRLATLAVARANDDVIVFGNAEGGLSRVAWSGNAPTAITRPPRGRGRASRAPGVAARRRAFSVFPPRVHDRRRRHLRRVDQRGARGAVHQTADRGRRRSGARDRRRHRGPLCALHARAERCSRSPSTSRHSRSAAIPISVAADVEGSSGNGWFTAAANGSVLVFRERSQSVTAGTAKLVWVDRNGSEEAIPAPSKAYGIVNLSPDGQRILLTIRDADSSTTDYWIWDVARQALSRLTTDGGIRTSVAWSRDSRRIAYGAATNATGGGLKIALRSADGSSEPIVLGVSGAPTDITADDRLIYSGVVPPVDTFMVSLDDANAAPTPLLTGSGNEFNATVSPNGAFIAYQSDETGLMEIFVRPFPNTSSGRWQISNGGGTRPLFSPDGRELYYYVEEGGGSSRGASLAGTVMAVPIDYEPDFRPGAARQLLSGYAAPFPGRDVYDITPDGQRFLMLKVVGDAEPAKPPLIFEQGWLDSVKQRITATH